MQSEQTLSKQQKESVFLLQIGTFLEYFDLMLYVHMAVLLNEIFFPPADPKTIGILTAFAFCSTYALRPLGALIFGYIGDHYGRKPTIIITTGMMALCCFLMANLPTYAEIGISAAVFVSILRVVQGMTSMGEIMGAMIYLTETVKPPRQYSAVASITIASTCGAMAALGIATLTTRYGFNWRIAFWIGSGIALIGVIARTKLRETPDYANAALKRRQVIRNSASQGLKQVADAFEKMKPFVDEKVNLKHFINFISLYCGWPLSFYLIYVYFIPVLKESCGYSSVDIILHNFFIAIIRIFRTQLLSYLSQRIYPLLLTKYIGFIFLLITLVLPFALNAALNNYVIFAIQASIAIFGLSGCPSDPIFIKYFPIFKRFTAVTFGYALARAVMYVIISFGLVYLTDWFGFYGIWVLTMPISLFWIKSIMYYEKLERQIGNYPLKGEWQVRPKTEIFDEI